MLFTMRDRFAKKRLFNPNNLEDLKVYKYYLKHNNWGKNGCPFELEWPWISLPYMIEHKIAEHTVNSI